MPFEESQGQATIKSVQDIIDDISIPFEGASGWGVDDKTKLARTKQQYQLFADAFPDIGMTQEQIVQLVGNIAQPRTRRGNQ